MNKKKILFSILKEINVGNEINEDTYGITKEEFGTIIEEGLNFEKPLIKGVGVIRNGQENKVFAVIFQNATLTIDGENYLKENSNWTKGYKLAKEIRDWL